MKLQNTNQMAKKKFKQFDYYNCKSHFSIQYKYETGENYVTTFFREVILLVKHNPKTIVPTP
jgi:hypothetical protein